RFYLSMEDNLMRIFGDPMRTKRLLQMAGMREGEVIESGMLTRQIEKAQRKVESHNFDIRKQLLLFDDVANDQRKVVYQQRTEIMGTEDLSAAIRGILEESVGTLMDQYMPKHAAPGDWDMAGLSEAVLKDFNARVDPKAWLDAEPEMEEPAFRERLGREVIATYDAKVARLGEPIMRHVEKDVMLRMLDQHWREHLAAMDYLRQGIHLRGYAQKDYRFEYKREAFELFAAMLDRVKFETVSILTKLEVRTQEEIDREEAARLERQQRAMRALQAQHSELPSLLSGDVQQPAPEPGQPHPPAPRGIAARPPPPPQPEVQGTFVRTERKVGRNEPCPCGSGKKYKNCHGSLSSGNDLVALAQTRRARCARAHLTVCDNTGQAVRSSRRRSALRWGRARAHRRASTRQAHGRALGVSGRQDGCRRVGGRGSRAGAAGRAWHRRGLWPGADEALSCV